MQTACKQATGANPQATGVFLNSCWMWVGISLAYVAQKLEYFDAKRGLDRETFAAKNQLTRCVVSVSQYAECR